MRARIAAASHPCREPARRYAVCRPGEAGRAAARGPACDLARTSRSPRPAAGRITSPPCGRSRSPAPCVGRWSKRACARSSASASRYAVATVEWSGEPLDPFINVNAAGRPRPRREFCSPPPHAAAADADGADTRPVHQHSSRPARRQLGVEAGGESVPGAEIALRHADDQRKVVGEGPANLRQHAAPLESSRPKRLTTIKSGRSPAMVEQPAATAIASGSTGQPVARGRDPA